MFPTVKKSLKELMEIIKTRTHQNQLPNKYTVLKVMGNGCYGKVLRCLDRDTGNLVAIKIPLSHDQCCREEAAMLTRLMSLKLDEHSIVKFHESFSVKQGEALVFESLEVSVRDHMIQNYRPMTLSEIRTVSKQMATALKALKNIGVIHTDIKPDNVMLVDQNIPLRAKLIDFGLAIDKSKAKQGRNRQALAFRAPEIILGLPFSEAIDMWSLGCMLFSMLFDDYLFNDPLFDTLRFMTELLGQPPDNLLNQAWHRHEFFIRTKSNGWRIKTREEFGKGSLPKAPRRRKFSSLDDLKKRSRYYAEDAAEYEQCIDLMKAMLTMDQNERITPDEVLQHPFITQKKKSIDPPTDQHSPLATVLPSGVILVQPASPENTFQLKEEEKSVSLHNEDNKDNEEAKEEANEEANEVSDVAIEYDNDNEECNQKDGETPLIPDDGDSKEKKKNCFQRFKSWFKRKFCCNRVSVM